MRITLGGTKANVVARKSWGLHREMSTTLEQRADALTARAGAVTVPVYLRDEKDRPQPIASAILLALNQARFLVTAGHVLDKMLNCDSAVPLHGHLLPVIGGPTRLRTPNSNTPAEDHFDLGFIHLTGPSWDSTDLSQFLALDELAFDVALAPRETFAVVGYPATKQRRTRGGSKLRSAAYRLAAIGQPPSTYCTLAYDPRVNLLLGFDKRKVWSAGLRQTAPDAFGMSGGGIWHFGKHLADASTPPRLAGVAIEWRRDTRDKVLVGTRIDQIIPAIAASTAG